MPAKTSTGSHSWRIQRAGGPVGRPHHSCEVRNSKLCDKGQHGERLTTEGVCWSKKFGKQCCSLQPCSFWANRHASEFAELCRWIAVTYMPVYRQRKSSFYGFHPPTCSSSLAVFILSVESRIKWVACVVMLWEGRDPGQADRGGESVIITFSFPCNSVAGYSNKTN